MGSKASLNHVYRTVWNRALGAMVAVAENTSSHSSGGSASLTSVGASYRAAPLALTLAIALAWSGGITDAYANPQGGVSTVGSHTTTTNGNQLTVTTTNGAGTNHSAINWQSFSIPAGSSTYFQQPSASSTSINRVVTSTPSLIFGTLGSNGNLVLINQSGITVGAGAVVDTAGFTASALRMSDSDAAAGRMRFGDENSDGGDVSVNGRILARHGDVVLLGSSVKTGAEALIQSPNGSTILAAGRQVEITARGLEGIKMQLQAPKDSVLNLGTLEGDAVGIFAGTLKHSGVIQANAVSTEGGKVVLKAVDKLSVDGSIQVAALGQIGGSILASATHVKLDSTALLDASGALGGGEVLVGGGYQGNDARLDNAQTTDIVAGAQLKADALVNGDGGTVVVWADGATRYRGSLSARGGALGGNGGIAEVSGKEYLDFRGGVDLTAAYGSKGSLLLDPTNIVIGLSADINGSGYGASDISDGMDLSNSSTYAGETSYITASMVGSLLTTADVTLAASNDITLNTDITTAGRSGSATTLTLNAGHDIVFNDMSGVEISSTTYALNVKLNAGNAIAPSSGYGASIYSNGGNISLTAGSGGIGSGAQSSTYLDSGGGAAAGNISITSGGVVETATISANGANGSSSTPNGFNGGTVSISASGAVSVGGISAKGGNGYGGSQSNGGSGSSVTVTASDAILGTVNVSGGSGAYGGAVGSGGSASLTETSGDIDYGYDLTVVGANSLNLRASAGRVTQSDVITVNTLTTYSNYAQSGYGTDLTYANVVANYSGTEAGSGDLLFKAHSAGSPAALNISGISVASGNLEVDNYGATTTSGLVSAGGTVRLEAHSPLTIGAGGVTAGGGITLGASSDLTLNGVIQSTGAGISFNAGGNMVQNSGVIAAAGITASAGGTVTFGVNGYSSGNPLSYTDVSGAVTAPVVPLSSAVSPGGAVADFLDQFLAALDEQQSFTDDPFDPRNRSQDGLVVEGQVCTP